MIRKIIKINKDLCNGCALCVTACHEGAIGLENGKATLLRDDYCDGLGDCLPSCPTGAITFEEREAAEYNFAATPLANGKVNSTAQALSLPTEAVRVEMAPLPCGCPGTHSKAIKREQCSEVAEPSTVTVASQLKQWPVQIKLVPTNAEYLNGAELLIAADCTAYAYGDFHNRFMKDSVTLIGCPKLDEGSYAEKLTAILRNNDIKSVTVVRMEVPCCGGIESAVKTALKDCGKLIPWWVHVISTDGEII